MYDQLYVMQGSNYILSGIDGFFVSITNYSRDPYLVVTFALHLPMRITKVISMVQDPIQGHTITIPIQTHAYHISYYVCVYTCSVHL